MNAGQHPATKVAGAMISILRAIYRQPSFKLAIALFAIFLFFVVAVGVHEAVSINSSNRQIISKLEAEGVPPDEVQEDTRLLDPWSEGYWASVRFLGRPNLELIARHTTIVGIAALGMTLVIIAGGIDLSVGSIIALSSVAIAWLLQYAGAGPWTAALGGIAAAAFCGLSVLVTRWLDGRLEDRQARRGGAGLRMTLATPRVPVL